MNGNLAEQSPFDVLAEVHRRRASGILRFQQEALVRQLFIDAGSIIRFAASNQPQESITALFRERGGINDQQLKQASVSKQGQELLGTTLVRLGFMGRDRLTSLTEEHVRRVLAGLADMNDGTFEFQAGALPFREQLDAGLRTAEVLLEWARKVSDVEWIRRRLGSGEARIVLSPRPPEGYQQIKLLPAEGFMMSRVDGSAGVRDICMVSPMGEEATLRALFALVLAGILEVADGAPAAPSGPPRPAAAVPPRAATPTVIPLAAPPRAGAPAPQAVGPAPAPASAGAAAAKVPGNGGAPHPVAASAARAAAKPAARPHAPPPRKAAPVAERRRPATSAELEQEMLQRFEQMRSQDLYQVLGVMAGAPADDIRRAYYGLAKKFHPDKFTVEEFKTKAEKVFAHITEAYSTLSHEAARKKYEEDQASRKAPTHEKGADTHDLARMNYRHGREMFEKARFGEAVGFFQNACDQDPSKADYPYYLGLAQSHNPRWKKDAEESFLKALKIDPTSARVYAELGALYAKGGLHSKARDMYKKALEWDPANQKALEGVEAEQGGKKGLLGMFRK